MKKLVTITIALFALGLSQTNAQSDYSTAVGLGIDFGEGSTLVGPSGKFFFSEESALLGEIMFTSGATVITALYEYHGVINNAVGLQWFAGVGPSVGLFEGGGSAVALRPVVGLDYKINSVPLAFSFDWRPAIGISDGGGFSAAAFGLGIRYVIN
jgi:hypothetical protein